MRVCCVLLADGRPAMVSRAIRSFHNQSYQDKRLVILDSGEDALPFTPHPDVHVTRLGSGPKRSIGELRNIANAMAIIRGPLPPNEVIAHWDSDDHSHAERLTEQVAHLETSGAQAVGYHNMIFWDSTKDQAWLFSSPNQKYCLGTSLLYWRSTWERIPFPHKSVGEDTEFCLRVKTSAVSSLGKEPRMIASIHDSNTSSKIIPGAREWTRLPRMDEVIGKVMAL